MTHRNDCTVLDEYRDELDEMARLFQEGGEKRANEMAGNFGWEELGRGVSRIVYRVSSEASGDVDVAPDSPCVVKFDTTGVDHLDQNEPEYRQFERFPEEIREGNGGPPIVVPIRDHADDFSWLSAPEAGTPEDPDRRGVIKRLSEVGIKCDDIRDDNVGEMHGEPVLLDYGLECGEATSPEATAELVEAEFLEVGANIRTTYGTPDGGWVVQFLGDDVADPGRRRAIDPSMVVIDPFGEVARATFVFGGYLDVDPADPPEELVSAAEAVSEEIRSSMMGIRPKPEVITEKVGGTVVASVAYVMDFDAVRAEMPPHILAEVWEAIAREVDETFPSRLSDRGLAPPKHTEMTLEEEIAEELEDSVGVF